MKRVYAVIELAETSTFDPHDDQHLDELAEDLLGVAHGVAAVSVYPTAAELMADEAPSALSATGLLASLVRP